MRLRLIAAILVVAGAQAFAHRFDEYLQGTIISVERDRIRAQMTLTPGVAVLPLLIAYLDTDADGVISATEQHAYAARVLRDLSLSIDGHQLTPELVSIRFPAIDEMTEGRGQIQLDFNAITPRGGRDRKLVLENHHQSRISAYQVNCLVPLDPHILLSVQTRNYSQSLYELDYAQTGPPSVSPLFQWAPDYLVWLGPIALFLMIRLVRGRWRASIA